MSSVHIILCDNRGSFRTGPSTSFQQTQEVSCLLIIKLHITMCNVCLVPLIKEFCTPFVPWTPLTVMKPRDTFSEKCI